MAGQRIVIPNTTPLINFAEIGRLDMLEELFGEITVPPSVVRELGAKAELFPSAALAADAVFLRVRPAANLSLIQILMRDIHEGEAECIALAMEQTSALLLLDDVYARSVAEHHGLLFMGTMGCLKLAKERGLIPAIAPLVAELRTRARFWLSEELVHQVLRDAGECLTDEGA